MRLISLLVVILMQVPLPLRITGRAATSCSYRFQSAVGNLQSQIFLSCSPVPSSSDLDAQERPYARQTSRPDPWYERVLKRINPSNFDYGAWLEQRRAIFLAATVTNPYFWYSFWVTTALVAMIVVHAKHRSDFHKYTWMSAGWMADFYNDMQFARDTADAAVEKYNQHIDKCNRAIEAELDGSWRQREGYEELEAYKQQIENLRRANEEITTKYTQVCRELEEKKESVISASLSVDILKNNFLVDGHPISVVETNKHLVNRINVLEREKQNLKDQLNRLRGK